MIDTLGQSLTIAGARRFSEVLRRMGLYRSGAVRGHGIRRPADAWSAESALGGASGSQLAHLVRQSSPMMPRAGWVAMARLQALLVVVLVCFSGRSAFAQPAPGEVPPDLRDWIPWVSADLGDAVCTQIGGEPRCVWPGELELDLDTQGGSFREEVLVEARLLHRLPGRPGAWPEDVRASGKPLPVVETGEGPIVVLEPGRYSIEGRFAWNRMPEVLDVGPLTGVVRLKIAGKDVPLVRREAGQLWLKGLTESEGESSGADEIRLAVFRQIRDGSPMLIETRLAFRVSGRAREIVLPEPNLKDTVALGVQGDLALSLERSGALRVQLVPGRHELTLLARRSTSDGALTRGAAATPWPADEVWTWHPDTRLRVV